jgi:hypothetical protein
MTLGDWTPEFQIANARAKAAALKVQIEAGKDPLGEQTLARLAYSARPTVGDIARDFIHEHGIPNDRPRTVVEYRSILARHILPVLKDRAVADVTAGAGAVASDESESAPRRPPRIFGRGRPALAGP